MTIDIKHSFIDRVIPVKVRDKNRDMNLRLGTAHLDDQLLSDLFCITVNGEEAYYQDSDSLRPWNFNSRLHQDYYLAAKEIAEQVIRENGLEVCNELPADLSTTYKAVLHKAPSKS